MNNFDPLLVLFLLFSMNPDGFAERLKEEREKEKQKEDLQQSYPYIEWEQDMGANIAFCGSTNDFCDYHCIPNSIR